VVFAFFVLFGIVTLFMGNAGQVSCEFVGMLAAFWLTYSLVLGLSAATAKLRVHRAKRKLSLGTAIIRALKEPANDRASLQCELEAAIKAETEAAQAAGTAQAKLATGAAWAAVTILMAIPALVWPLILAMVLGIVAFNTRRCELLREFGVRTGLRL